VGTLAALALVTVVLLLRTGELPELWRLTRYSYIYGEAGYSLLPTPTFGLHLILYASFLAALTVAALRRRAGEPDRATTGALAYAGVFGIGAGGYFMGRSNPVVLVAIFSAWGVCVALLALLAVRSLASRARQPGSRPASAFPIAVALCSLGLIATAIGQFPAPWTQVSRIAERAPRAIFDRSPASAFVKRTAVKGEAVVVLASLGHLIAHEAGVVNVSPYSHPSGVLSYNQLDEVTTALRDAHGTRFYLGASSPEGMVWPEISEVLRTDGFRPIAYDPASQLTEWRRQARSS